MTIDIRNDQSGLIRAKDVVSKCLLKVFKENTHVVIVDKHDMNNPISIADVEVPNSTKSTTIVIVNWGYYKEIELFNNDYLNSVGLISEGTPCKFIKEELAKSEKVISIKGIGDIATVLVRDDGLPLVFICADLFHLIDSNKDELVNPTLEILYEIMKNVALTGSVNNITNEDWLIFEKKKAAEVQLNTKDYDFRSISSAVRSSGFNNEEIIKEMLDRVDYKSIITLLKASFFARSMKVEITIKEVREWLTLWAQSKYDIYILFGRKFTINKSIEIKKDEVLGHGQVIDFRKQFPKYYTTISEFYTEEMLENKVLSRNKKCGDVLPLQEGAKVSKYLSTLFGDKDFDLELSKFMQNNNINSTIYISIDPMDYLTSSINNCGWTSCHSIYGGGQPNGSFSYLFDSSSLVAFLSNRPDSIYNLQKYNFVWNSKSWRQMIYLSVNNNNAIFSREYPQNYSNEELSKTVRGLLESTISDFCSIENRWIKSKNTARTRQEYCNKSDYHYDDIVYQNTVSIKHIGNKTIEEEIKIGNHWNCLKCGNIKEDSLFAICRKCFK